MSLITRFTRDEASKYVWGLLLLAAIGGLLFAVMRAGDALERARTDAQVVALDHVDRLIEPKLGHADLTSGASIERAIGGPARMLVAGEGVERIRIWSPSGALLYSTDRSDQVGSDAALNDRLLRRAGDRPVTVQDASDTGGANDPERTLVRTYAPTRSATVEVDQADAATIAPVRSEWFWIQVTAGAAVALFLLLSILSLRDPIEPINTGVPLARSSIPRGYSLIDDERLSAVEEVYRLASARVERLEQKLAESESARRNLEGDLQRQLSGGTVKPAASAPAPASAPAAMPGPPAVPAPAAPDVVQVPESEVVGSTGRWAASAGPLARATQGIKPKAKPADDATSRMKRAVATTPRRAKPKPVEPKRVQRKTVRADPEPVVEKAPEIVTPPAAQMLTEAPRPAAAAAPARAAAPAPVPTRVEPAPTTVTEDAAAHRDALETFIRLTESDRQPHEASQVDQGAVRAALARTAARKKPGGEKLKGHDGPQETDGGPPPEPR
ncbi:MAG TPA: hypothetical protein VFA25_02240 [Actinomycetota bacterium]|nr:hypothetical protein [Actinomycetota bacterium]